MKPMYIVVPFLSIASCLFFLYSSNPNIMDVHDKPLIIGIAAGYAPYISINETGAYEGFDIDVADAVSAQLNRPITLKDLGSMSSLMMALDQGSVDMIMWGLSITPDRLNKIAMVHYQGEKVESNPLLFWQKVPAGITTLADMKGMTVCVEPASLQSDIIAHYEDINILPTEKVDDALLNIQYGKADAALVDPAIAKKFQAKFPELIILDVPLSEGEESLGVGIAVKKDNNSLMQQLQKAVNTLKQEGVIATAEQKWGLV